MGAGPAHRQLVAALPGHQAHRRLRLRDLVQGRARAASSCSRSAATTPTSTATATRRCRGSACAGASAARSSIKAGSYFALTSEALMAGGDFEASAQLRPGLGRGQVRRPRHRLLRSVPLPGQRLRAHRRRRHDRHLALRRDHDLDQPRRAHRGRGARLPRPATFEVGPIELTVEFGGSDQARARRCSAPTPSSTSTSSAADGGGARAHAVMTVVRRAARQGRGRRRPTARRRGPFIVVVEFGLTFTSTVPAAERHARRQRRRARRSTPPSRALGVAPMGERHDRRPSITLDLDAQDGAAQPFPFVGDAAAVRPLPGRRVGAGRRTTNNRKVPKAEMVEALNELDLVCAAATTRPAARRSRTTRSRSASASRCRSRARRPRSARCELPAQGASPALVAAAGDGRRGVRRPRARSSARTASPTALAALRGERQAPPRARHARPKASRSPTSDGGARRSARPVPGKVYDHFVDAPVAVGLLRRRHRSTSASSPKARTTVKDSAKAWRVAPPTLAAVDAERSRSIAGPAGADRCARRPRPRRRDQTARHRRSAPASVPLTGDGARARPAIVARSGAPLAAPLAAFNAALAPARRRRPRARRATRGAARSSRPARPSCSKLPNAKADAAATPTGRSSRSRGAPARVVLLGHGGRLLADASSAPARRPRRRRLVIPRGTERIVAIGQGLGSDGDAPRRRRPRRLARRRCSMPYVGLVSAVGPGCVVHAHERRDRRRTASGVDAGWVSGAELARGISDGHARASRRAPRTVRRGRSTTRRARRPGRRAPAAARPRRRRRAPPTRPARARAGAADDGQPQRARLRRRARGRDTRAGGRQSRSPATKAGRWSA